MNYTFLFLCKGAATHYLSAKKKDHFHILSRPEVLEITVVEKFGPVLFEVEKSGLVTPKKRLYLMNYKGK